MQPGVKFNLKIIILTAKLQLVSEAEASGFVKGQGGGEVRRQRCHYSWTDSGVGNDRQNASTPGTDSGAGERRQVAMPALLGQTVACLTCSRSELPVQNGHSATREQGWQGAFSQNCSPFCTVPGRTRPVLLLSNCPHWLLLIPFLWKEANWLSSRLGKWNKASGLRAAPSLDSQGRGCLDTWQRAGLLSPSTKSQPLQSVY